MLKSARKLARIIFSVRARGRRSRGSETEWVSSARLLPAKHYTTRSHRLHCQWHTWPRRRRVVSTNRRKPPRPRSVSTACRLPGLYRRPGASEHVVARSASLDAEVDPEHGAHGKIFFRSIDPRLLRARVEDPTSTVARHDHTAGCGLRHQILRPRIASTRSFEQRDRMALHGLAALRGNRGSRARRAGNLHFRE